RSDDRDRSYGGLPAGSTAPTGKTDPAKPQPETVREDFTRMAIIEAAVSVARRPGSDEPAVRCLWPATSDVGHGLADLRSAYHLRQDADAGPRRSEVLEC